MTSIPRHLAFVLLLATVSAGAQPASEPLPAISSPSISASEWRQDLQYMAAQMKSRHKNLHHRASPAQFQAAVDRLHARIPGLQRHEIIVELMRLAAMVGDGHTNVSPLKDPSFQFRELPLKLYWFEDGIHVRAATPEHASLVGSAVVAIGGVPIEEVIRRIAEITPRDNDMGLRFHAPILLALPEIQHALGLSGRTDASTITLRSADQETTVTLDAGAVPAMWPPDTDISLATPDGWVDGRSTPAPLWLQAPLDYHRMVALPAQNALYVQLNMVTGTDSQSLEQFGDAILRQVRTTNPGSVILDLRLNRGGNHDLRFPFIAGLIKAEDEDTRLYVLAGRGSFSATQRLLDDLSNYSDAVLVGEPASSRPNSYGDSYKDTLPNSGIAFRTSMLWHQLDHRDLDWTPIDIAAPLAYDDYLAGRDPALDVALQRQVPTDLPSAVAAAAGLADAAAVTGVIEAYLGDPTTRHADVEQSLVDAIVPLLSMTPADVALAAAELAAARLPDSTRALTVLAFAYHRAGQPERAREAARRVVDLDPNNRDVRRLLED